jgi:hypothetical protein
MSVEELLGDMMSQGKWLEANWLETTVFLNRGGSFEARPLPVEAQMAPAFGVSVGDLDGDSHEDLFLSQNMFALFAMTPRYDAGGGLWLKGDGQGGFRAVAARESGIRIDGEQRGSALADFDEDGRVDLAVAQNGAALKLYRNQSAVPGLRVRLKGSAKNPGGVGAILRLETDRGKGPAREIHAGSGYWSQDGAVQVMTGVGSPKAVWVRWPGQPDRSWPIPPGAREVTVTLQGSIETVR